MRVTNGLVREIYFAVFRKKYWNKHERLRKKYWTELALEMLCTDLRTFGDNLGVREKCKMLEKRSWG